MTELSLPEGVPEHVLHFLNRIMNDGTGTRFRTPFEMEQRHVIWRGSDHMHCGCDDGNHRGFHQQGWESRPIRDFIRPPARATHARWSTP